MKKISFSTSVLVVVIAFYAVGLAGHLLAVTRPWMLLLTPWFLVASGIAVLTPYLRGQDPRVFALWFGPVFVATFALEAVGVATGLVFGPYHYTTVLGSLLWGVPPVIGLNWVLVVLGVHTGILSLFPRAPEWVRVAAVAAGCVAFDLVLEPVAVGLGYWVWHTATIPLQNYVAWGVIAAGASWWAGRLPPLPLGTGPAWYGLVQAAFFLGLVAFGVKA